MTAAELEALYSELSIPPAGMLAARRLLDDSAYRVATFPDGAAALLVSFEDEGLESYGSRLEHVEYRPREHVRLENPKGEIIEGLFAIVACRDADAGLRAYFFRVLSMLLDELGERPTAKALDESIGTVLELFRALERPGRKSVQGVWAELLLIAESAEPSTMVAAWHADPEELFDFVGSGDRLEIKSTSGPHRAHRVSLEQVAPRSDGHTLLVSCMLEHSHEGASVDDLADLVHSRLPKLSELHARLEKIIALGLGASWREVASARFDRESALDGMRVFDVVDVPSVSPRFPSVDLSSVEPIAPDDARVLGSLFAAAFPGEGSTA